MNTDASGDYAGRALPPGWYQDPSGAVRWWDGRAWNMIVPNPAPGRTWAVLSYLSFFVMPFVPAIILRVTVGRGDRFTRHHTNEALNAQIWFGLIWNAGFPLYDLAVISPVPRLAKGLCRRGSARGATQVITTKS